MNTEYTALALLGIGLAAVVLLNLKGGMIPSGTDEIVGMSQNPADANTIGPAYLVAKMPWGLGPPVMMQPPSPVTSKGFAGQSQTFVDPNDCGCA